MAPVILCGLGFTTRRLARRLLCRGLPTFALIRNPERFSDLRAVGLQLGNCPEKATLIHTIPPLPCQERCALRERIADLNPRRIVYISSTGVYGNLQTVDENTAAQPSDERGRERIEEETWLASGPWQTHIIRAAAIYGPGRGVHVRVFEGRLPRTEPGAVTSRIHVDDLAAVLEAAALSDLTGASPIADDYPCPTAEVAEWCSRILGKELTGVWRDGSLTTAGRRVDGRKIRELLGTALAYPDYRSGTLASLAQEKGLRPRMPREPEKRS